ncbi:glycoside hydrolase family 24 protein [Serratia silvae]|uniref:Glycoside hydrolase family 104 protein n=1 Tax=Serratia silvae TaxID=2824122 RepID=A0ABT0KH53_9GAMM|nr:glycoside hydrolase family 104 protein [Serratia silvae]MCL1031364.1 glycoside hydrolase family 104 protein [Serratia silvae]
MNINRKAFRATIAFSEGTSTHKLTKNDGYDVIVTGLDMKLEVFTDYSDHPFANGRPSKVFNKKGETSSASGRYQLMKRWWKAYKVQLKLTDFSPASQDAVAMQQIKERGALDDIDAGRIESAIYKCRKTWASFPGANYEQHENSLEKLLKVFVDAGGILSE